MPTKKQRPQESIEPNLLSFKQIIHLQLIWYVINFLIIFSQNNIGFNLPYFNNLYQVSFKIIGRSFFVSFLLYTTITHNLEFSDLGLNWSNFLTHFSLGIKFSSFLLIGLIIINISLANFSPLIKVTNPFQLATSLFYFGLVCLGLLVPAFSKELFYRGLLYQYFHQRWGSIAALTLTPLYYTISYLDLRPMPLVIHFLVGAITTYLYHKTNNLTVPVVFQTVYQSGLTVYLFSFSDWPF